MGRFLSAVAGLIQVRFGDRRVHPGSMGSLGRVLLFDGFSRCRWVHRGALWCSSCSSGVAVFIGVRTTGRRVHSGWLDSGSLVVVGFIRLRLGGHRVHQRLLCSLGCTLGVVGCIRGRSVHWDAPWASSGSSEVAGFIGVRPGGGQFHPGSLGSLGCTVVVVGFIRARWVHWGAA